MGGNGGKWGEMGGNEGKWGEMRENEKLAESQPRFTTSRLAMNNLPS